MGRAAYRQHDLDFGSILAVTHGARPSVVQIREDDISGEQFGKHLMAVLHQVLPDLEHGALVTVEANRTRIRRLCGQKTHTSRGRRKDRKFGCLARAWRYFKTFEKNAAWLGLLKAIAGLPPSKIRLTRR